jgi:hypothetical protein
VLFCTVLALNAIGEKLQRRYDTGLSIR